MIVRLRVILDVKEDIFRDIEIETGSNLEDLHNAIISAFALDGKQMASFYFSDDNWTEGKEVPLIDMYDNPKHTKTMGDTLVGDVFTGRHQRMLYVYDFMNLRTFYVEVLDIKATGTGGVYPAVVYSYGDAPDYLDGDFEEIEDSEALDFDSGSEGNYDDDDIFDDEDFNEMGYDEQDEY